MPISKKVRPPLKSIVQRNKWIVYSEKPTAYIRIRSQILKKRNLALHNQELIFVIAQSRKNIGKMSASDETVSEFMSFTGSNDPTEAQHYLEMSGGNLQTAVSLYMEHSAGGDGGGGIAGAGSAAAPQGVRAPDQTRTMRLMEDHHHPSLLAGAGLMGPVGFNSLMDPTMQMMNAMMEEEMTSAFAPVALPTASAAVRSRGSSVGNEMDEQKDEEDEYQYDMEDGDDDDEVQIVQPTLSDMFAPPTHLIHRAGGFQGARTMAKDTKRWLLVNIQRDNEFSSHALNRDVWRDELIENLVREGFIFFQVVSSVTGQVSFFLHFSHCRIRWIVTQRVAPMLNDTT